jgi:magnesium transporter
MISIFKTFGGFTEITELEKGCWINVVNPTLQEIENLSGEFGLPDDLITDILDVDERPRVEFDDDWTLVILRIPIAALSNGVPFHTVPLGIFITENFTMTLCIKENEVLPIKQRPNVREQYREITDHMNFILRLFLRSGGLYLRYLKQINQMTASIEQDLEISIKTNEIVLARLRNSRKIITELNEDLFEDAVIENKQALEMAEIYSDIQSGMMDAFASVISNNLNVVMKQLTLISIILMIPTLIASIFGMNVPNFMEHSLWSMPAIIFSSLLLSFLGVMLFRKRQWF